MRKKLLVVVAVVAMTVAGASPAVANDDFELQAKNLVDTTNTLPCGNVDLDIATEGWFQLHQNQEGNGIRVTTFRQSSTYTNPETGETLVIQNVGVARVYFDGSGEFTHAEVAGHSHLPGGSGNLIYGLQDPSGPFAVGHEVSPCEQIG